MKLTRANMEKKLNMPQEEIELVLQYQKAFPSLQDTSREAEVSGRTLWEELRVKQAYTDWMKKQLEVVNAMEDVDYHVFFKKNVNFTQEEVKSMSSQQRSRHGISTDYILTLDTAKNICMVTGVAPRTNEETKKLSQLARSYFIVIERAFRLADCWEETRFKSKELHKKMMASYEEEYIEQYGRKPRDYGVLQNDVYRVCFDMDAKQLKDRLDIEYSEVVPDWVEEKLDGVLCYTYTLMITFIRTGLLDREERFRTVTRLFDKEYGGPIELW